MLERTVDTQFGSLVLRADKSALTRLTWGRATREDPSDVLDAAAAQLAEYDAGVRETFDLPLRVSGSDLQRSVCAEMQKIPFGETVTYGDVAKRLGVPAQAVGQACGGNPIAIVIPCHRVMGAKGLTGFSGGEGVETKVALLRHEKAGGFLI
ncbi:MAG: methylated-DNA--[protein]-cysteine S-methyltransferase [Pseudomonadota bacterium]